MPWFKHGIGRANTFAVDKNIKPKHNQNKNKSTKPKRQKIPKDLYFLVVKAADSFLALTN